MWEWRANVKLANGSIQKVTVRADSAQNAKQMLEAQYGRGSITVSPQKVYE